MKPDQVFELYEKLYFHEVDAREKIAGRLQIPLAILLSPCVRIVVASINFISKQGAVSQS
jgi:hypothetical protein